MAHAGPIARESQARAEIASPRAYSSSLCERAYTVPCANGVPHQSSQLEVHLMRKLFLAGALGAALVAASFAPWTRPASPDGPLGSISPTEMTIAGPALPAGATYDSF
jgi:hypothetical protein